jgi:protein-disulfide isomerase
MTIPREDVVIHLRRNAIAAVVTIFVLAVACTFAWRVYHFASRMQSGELTEADLTFTGQYTASNVASDAPVPDGEFDVATEDDPSLGPKDAVLTVVEFADFGCAYSREESFVVRSMASTFGDRVRFVYRDFPITELHPDAMNASEAAECAAEQGRFWEYHDKLYANQDDLSESALVRYAAELNLNQGEFKRCLASDRNLPEIEEDIAAGTTAGVRGTPTFFFNGIRIPGAIPEDVFIKLIERFMSANDAAGS